jgi:hypothetical protein
LRTLLTDLDRINWDDATMAHLVYEQLPIGSKIAGGMGGGEVTAAAWVHPEIAALGSSSRSGTCSPRRSTACPRVCAR